MAGGVPRHLAFKGRHITKELSIFVDESGGQKGHSAYCIVTLVFHEQANDLSDSMRALESNLRTKSLPDIPFHASPLMYGKGPYKDLPMDIRKMMLGCFEAFCRRAPFTCRTFSYPRKEVEPPDLFIARFKRDLVVLLTDNLEYFQAFRHVKIYYDNGQQMITAALRGALEFVLSNDAVLYRMASPQDYRLSQVADCICTLELTDIKFQYGGITETDAKVFGVNHAAFKKNHLRHIRKKALI